MSPTQPTEESVKAAEQLSHQRMTNGPLPKKREDAPYYLFGKKFSDRRHALALSKEHRSDKYRKMREAARCLNMDRTHLFLIEEGQILPNKEDLPKIAEYLKKDPERIQFWYDLAVESYEKHLQNQPLEHGALRYSQFWEIQENDFRKWYCETSGADKVDPPIARALKRFREQATRVFTLDLLPMPTFIILSELLGHEDEATYLHEIQDVVMVGESLAAFIARDPYLATYGLYAANQIFFRKDPKKNIEDCFNCLTVDQFSIILHVALENSGVYAFGEDLTTLQSIHEFSSHGILLARGLKQALKGDLFPADVDYHNLVMGLALQNLGVHAFYSILKPSLLKDDLSSRGFKKQKAYQALNEELWGMLNWEFHAPISGGMAANWGFDEAVVRLVIDHHTQPVDKVTPICAMLKLINSCVDRRFYFKSRDELQTELQQYPQLKLPTELLYQLLLDIKELVDKTVQQSSSIVSTRASQVSEVTQSYAKGYQGHVPGAPGDFVPYQISASGAELRLTTDYQKALINECYFLSKQFQSKMTSARKHESLDSFGERMKHLELVRYFLKHHLMEATAHQFHMPPKDVEAALLNLSV